MVRVLKKAKQRDVIINAFVFHFLIIPTPDTIDKAPKVRHKKAFVMFEEMKLKLNNISKFHQFVKPLIKILSRKILYIIHSNPQMKKIIAGITCFFSLFLKTDTNKIIKILDIILKIGSYA